MTPPPGPLTADGARLALAERLGRGGEGTVYALRDDAARAVKLYSLPDPGAREAKVRAMVEAKLWRGSDTVAFPQALVRDGEGAFRGFIMARVDGAEPIHQLYTPASRKKLFANADYRFLVRAALNVARAVAAVHAAGAVIGDLNHSALLVGQDARVTLIDADSVQFEADGVLHRCPVGVPDYTAPELYGRTLAEVTRTVDHDAFALAVILFQVLFVGRHPFVGLARGAHVTLPEAIAAHRFAFSRERLTGLSPPPGTPTLDDVPPALARLFEAAFAPEGAGRRPTPLAFIKTLGNLEAGLERCPVSPRHHVPPQVGLCPWCEVELLSGTPLFLPAGATVAGEGDPRLPPFDEAAHTRRLAAIEPAETFALTPPAGREPTQPPPHRSPWPRRAKGTAAAAMIALALTISVMVPQAWTMGAPVGIAGFFWLREALRADSPARADLQSVDSRLSRALVNHVAAIDLDGPVLRKARLQVAIHERAAMAHAITLAEQALRRDRRNTARENALAAAGVADAPLTDARKASLLAAGFATAADILSAAEPDAPGAEAIGWARRVESAARLDVTLTEADRSALGRKNEAIATRARALQDELAREFEALGREVAAISAARTTAPPALQTLLDTRRALEVEIESLGGIPPAPPKSPSLAVSESARQNARAIRERARAASRVVMPA